MPHSKKAVGTSASEVKTEVTVDPEAELYRAMVYKIRGAKTKAEVNEAFKTISDGLEVKIKKIAGKFKIPGFSFDDIYQECLYALQYKAIKDYDETRGSTEGPALFDRFALLCIRRHLATTLKTAHQNRKRILNESKSLDQDRSHDNDDLSLINIVKRKQDAPILDRMEVREFIKNFTKKLLSKLSKFEQEVFVQYVQKYSYEEIAQDVVGSADSKAVKAIDNGLSRIKHKSWEIYEKMVGQDQVPPVAMKWFEEETARRAAAKPAEAKPKKSKRGRKPNVKTFLKRFNNLDANEE